MEKETDEDEIDPTVEEALIADHYKRTTNLDANTSIVSDNIFTSSMKGLVILGVALFLLASIFASMPLLLQSKN